MAIATKCTCGYSITGVCTSSVKECRQLRKENTQLPKEVVEEIKLRAEAVYSKLDVLAQDVDQDFGLPMSNKVKSPIEEELTAYATKLQYSEERNSILLDEMSNLSKLLQEKDDKLHQANETTKVLEYDNNKLKGEVEGFKEAHEDHQRLVRHLDILINGDAAAEQASLCDLVNQIESFGLPAVKNPNYKAGALWVKCWEQKPDTHKVRFKDKHGNEFIGNYSKDTGQYWAYGLGQAINDVIYWQPQDESAAGREEDAVEFAEWLLEYGYEPSFEKKWVDYSKTGDNRVSSAQLYELFKQQKEK